MKRVLALAVVAAAGCDATLMNDLTPVQAVGAFERWDMKAVTAKVADLIQETMLGPRAQLTELKVLAKTPAGVFPFEAEVTVKTPSSFPGFAGGYLYKTEIHSVKGSYDPKTSQLKDVKKRKIATQG